VTTRTLSGNEAESQPPPARANPEGTPRMRAKLAILAVLVGAALPAAARADLLQDIRSRGTLKVGMAEYFPGW
jgi:hypothetical protein